MEKSPIVGMVVRGPRKYPELGRCEFWIVVSNPNGRCKSFYYKYEYDDDNDTSKTPHLMKFIKKIARYAGVGVEHEDIEELIYIMRCTIFEDPI